MLGFLPDCSIIRSGKDEPIKDGDASDVTRMTPGTILQKAVLQFISDLAQDLLPLQKAVHLFEFEANLWSYSDFLLQNSQAFIQGHRSVLAGSQRVPPLTGFRSKCDQIW